MTPEIDLRDTRRDYQGTGIRRADMHSDPVQQFATWLQDVVDANAIDATSMTLATASKAAIPSARIVLLKHFDRHGFCWYTDSRSQKANNWPRTPTQRWCSTGATSTGKCALLAQWKNSAQKMLTIIITAAPKAAVLAQQHHIRHRQSTTASSSNNASNHCTRNTPMVTYRDLMPGLGTG